MGTRAILTILLASLLFGCASLFSREEEVDRDPVKTAALRLRSPASSSGTRENTQASYLATQQLLVAKENRDLVPGMSMADVEEIWGQPQEIQMAGMPGTGYERWIYFEGLSSAWSVAAYRVVYFDEGRVSGWETPR
ncbi:MAG: hypothetical protein NDJ89_18975 [Oligoflexia bacterium]|nr:hypothetical protein [Oligoflexia bacterium]